MINAQWWGYKRRAAARSHREQGATTVKMILAQRHAEETVLKIVSLNKANGDKGAARKAAMTRQRCRKRLQHVRAGHLEPQPEAVGVGVRTRQCVLPTAESLGRLVAVEDLTRAATEDTESIGASVQTPIRADEAHLGEWVVA